MSRKEKIFICDAGNPDLISVLRIERMSFPTPWSEAIYRAELARERSVFLVAKKKRDVIGYGCAWVVYDEGHILKIAVDPAFRNKGIGRALMEVLTENLQKRGVQDLWLEVRDQNEVARSFYRSLGFEEVGVRSRYYSDTGEDAVLMLKLINAPARV